MPPAAIGADVAGGRVIYSTETPYQYARVVQFPDAVRWLQLNEGVAIHSLYRPGSFLTGGYWDDFLVLPLAAQSGVPGRIAILGDAAGTVARAYGHYFPGARVDAVELDGELTSIGKRYFAACGPEAPPAITADARPWLAASSARYDAIFLDAYRQPYIPFYLDHAWIRQPRCAHLRTRGVLIVNVGHLPDSDALEKVVSATLHCGRSSRWSSAITLSDTNSVVSWARSRPFLGSGSCAGARAQLPRELQGPLTWRASADAGTPRGGRIYTDDIAPVEWLTDKKHYKKEAPSRRAGVAGARRRRRLATPSRAPAAGSPDRAPGAAAHVQRHPHCRTAGCAGPSPGGAQSCRGRSRGRADVPRALARLARST